MVDSGINQSVERAFALLRAFSTTPQARASDLAKLADLGLSTATRLLATLESLDAVERDTVTGLYRLGPAMITLGGVAINQLPVYREARQVAHGLAASTNLGANVATRRGDRMFYLLNVEGSVAPKSHTLMGQTNPLHATGLGKCLLLALSPDERRDLLKPRGLVGFTAHTITDFEALDAEMARIQARAYATELEELALGRACVAAPIRDNHGHVVAALSLSGPLSALDLAGREAERALMVIEAADRISVAIGYRGPHHAAPMPSYSESAG